MQAQRYISPRHDNSHWQDNGVFMEKLVGQIDGLADLSREILSELESGEPSVDQIEELLRKRSRVIDTMHALSSHIDISRITSEEQNEMARGFQTFRSLHETIQESLRQFMQGQQQKVNHAERHRKADDRYRQGSEVPDISYITDQ